MRWAARLVCTGCAAFALGAAAAAQEPTGIEVQSLGAVDPFAVGIDDALPSTVWSSGDAQALRAALALPPSGLDGGWSQPTAARLALRALLSAGEPPRGAEVDFELAALRADRALAAGRAEPVYELLSRTPRLNRSSSLSRLFAETAFALGRPDEACRAADALLSGRESPYWLRARAACLAFRGSIPAAELTAELARAQTPDARFDRIFDALVLDRDLPRDAAAMSGLELAIAAALAPEQRLEAAADAPAWLHRAAERTGPRIALPSQLPEALEAAVELSGPDRAAALGALAQQDLDRVIAAEALAIRLRDAALTDRFVETARAYGPEVASLPITGDTLAHGAHFVLAALIADDVVAAEMWRDALMDGPPRAAPPSFPSAPGEAGVLAPPPGYAAEPVLDWTPPDPAVMVALAFARAVALDQIEDDAFMALLAARIEGATPRRLCQAAALTALGANDQGELRAAMTGLEREDARAAPVVGPALLAAAAGALGETQLHAAWLLETHPQDAESCAAAAFALDAAGLRAEATRLVLEMIVEEAA